MTLPARRFTDDDDAAQYWLGILQRGSQSDRIEAREQLAKIFERRSMFEEATELLISNVHDGVRNSDIFRWLARLYRAQGHEVLAMQSAAEAAKYMSASDPVVGTISGGAPPSPPPGMAIIPPAPTFRAPVHDPHPAVAAPVTAPRNVAVIVLVALPLSWLAGIGFGMLFFLAVGIFFGQTSSGAGFVVLVMLTSWVPIAAYWVLTSRTPRHVARRALITLAVESFALPVAALVMGFMAGMMAAASAPASTAGAALQGGAAAR
jgi:hypothetical protein